MSIWLPKILMHKQDKLSLNPYSGEKRDAWNLPPFGVWYTDDTPSWVLEQEKAEFWFHLCTLGIYFVISQFVHPMRVWVEVWSRAIEIRAWMSHYGYASALGYGYTTWKVAREARKIANHKAYRIHLTPEEIEAKLWKRLRR